MEWLNNLTNGENGSAINLVLITLAIAILLIVIVWIFRKITGTATRRAMRSRVPRLSITDSTTVDDKRYLVMVRRDNVEHLLLIGGSNDLVVESNIVRAQTAQKQTAPANTAAPLEKTEISAEEEKQPLAAPIASVAAAGTAGLAATSALASDASNAVSETASSATEAIVDKASDLAQSTSDVASDVVNNVTEQSSEAIDAVVESVSLDIDSLDIEPEITTEEITEPVVETVEAVETTASDLESTISAQLDDALSGDALEIDVSETPQEDQTSSNSNDDADDEMQRLLNELSGESKEPA